MRCRGVRISRPKSLRGRRRIPIRSTLTGARTIRIRPRAIPAIHLRVSAWGTVRGRRRLSREPHRPPVHRPRCDLRAGAIVAVLGTVQIPKEHGAESCRAQSGEITQRRLAPLEAAARRQGRRKWLRARRSSFERPRRQRARADRPWKGLASATRPARSRFRDQAHRHNPLSVPDAGGGASARFQQDGGRGSNQRLVTSALIYQPYLSMASLNGPRTHPHRRCGSCARCACAGPAFPPGLARRDHRRRRRWTWQSAPFCLLPGAGPSPIATPARPPAVRSA